MYSNIVMINGDVNMEHNPNGSIKNIAGICNNQKMFLE